MSPIDDLPPPERAAPASGGISDLPPPPSANFKNEFNSLSDNPVTGFLGFGPQSIKARYEAAHPGQGIVEGDVPLVAPIGAPIAAAGRIAEALGDSGKLAANAMRVPQAITNPLVTLGTGKGLGYSAGRTALMGTMGGAQGALQPAENTDERAANIVKGAALGAGSQGLAEGIGGIVNAVGGAPASMQNRAEERAFKSSGAMLKDYRKAAGQDRINELGRYMIDNDLTKAGMTYQDVAEAADTLKSKHGTAIGDILEQLDQAGASAPSHADLASKLEAQAEPLAGMNTAKPTYSALKDMADDIRTMGKDSKSGSFKGAQKVKEFISDQIDKTGGWHAPNPSEKNLALRDAYHMVNGEIESAAGNAAQSVGDEQLLKNYTSQKAGYRNSLELAKIAKDQALRQNANRFFSPSDMFSGGMGALAGFSQGDSLEERLKHAAQGAALGVANKAIRTYGTPLISTGLDVGSSVLAGTKIPSAARAVAPYVRASAAIAGLKEGGEGATPVESVAKNKGKKDREPAQGFADGGEVKTIGEIIGYPGSGTQPKPVPKEKPRNYAQGGGPVPGVAAVKGNSPKNDTVPAKLSPGEIVLPRSVTMAKNAPEAAAKFVTDHLKKNTARGPSAWAEQGASKLGLEGDVLKQVLQSPKGKNLLIQASDLAPKSKAMQRIKDQIQKGWGAK